MTYFIGGNSDSEHVSQNDLDQGSTRILKQYGSTNGMSRSSEIYDRTKVSINGDIKTFYIISGKHPKIFKETIVRLWDEVETEVYAL